MSKASEILKRIKDAKNYVKKKAKSFGDGAPKKKTKPKAKSNGMNAEQKKALKETQARNNLNKPKAKPKAKPSAQNKATNTNKANTGGSNAPMKDKGKAKVQPRQLDFNKAKKSVVGIAGAGAGAGYLAGRNSGSKSAPTKSASTKGNGGSQRTAPKYVEPKGGNIASRTDNSDGSKVGPNMSQVNKPNANKPDANKPERRKGPSGPTMTSMGRPSTGPKPTNKDEKVDLKKRGPSRPSMTGFRHGGAVGATKMGKVRTAKPRNINGIAKRGLTRAKHR